MEYKLPTPVLVGVSALLIASYHTYQTCPDVAFLARRRVLAVVALAPASARGATPCFQLHPLNLDPVELPEGLLLPNSANAVAPGYLALAVLRHHHVPAERCWKKVGQKDENKGKQEKEENGVRTLI